MLRPGIVAPMPGSSLPFPRPENLPDSFNISAGPPSHGVRIESTPRAEMVDRQTFDRLMLDHLDGAQRFAIRLTGDAASAEELVQEALVRAAGAWRSFRGTSTFRTWLLQVVVNVFRDRLRARAGPAGLEDANDVADARDVEPA